jgi:glycosyltransferase involved in cell wall biosynthesis
MHDTDCGDQLTEARAAHIDAVMVLSRWHEAHVHSLYPFLGGRVRLTTNAINPAYFTERDSTPVGGGTCAEAAVSASECAQSHTVLFSSSPDRGLDFLLRLWPKVRKQVPDAELHYCYSSVYDAVAEKSPPIAAFRDELRALSNQPGVVNLGSFSQPDLAEKMREAHVWVAPSWSTPSNARFCETFCIGAVEAAAAGCVMVASDWGALPERVAQAGPRQLRLLSSPNFGPPDEGRWVKAIVAALRQQRPRPSKAALELTWACVARDFQAAIEDAAPVALAA